MRLVYLPPYSPDFNPIKEGFSAMKAWLRANHEFVKGELMGLASCDPIAMLWDAVFSSITAESAYGWYKNSKYL